MPGGGSDGLTHHIFCLGCSNILLADLLALLCMMIQLLSSRWGALSETQRRPWCSPPPGASHYIKESAQVSAFSLCPAHPLASFLSTWTFLFPFKHAKVIPAMSQGLSTCRSSLLRCLSFTSIHNHLSHYSYLISNATIPARLSLATLNKELLSALGDILYLFYSTPHIWNYPAYLFKYLLGIFTR